MTTPDKLRLSAQRFGLARVDRSIATWVRQYAKAHTSDWTKAENALLRILLDLAIIAPEDLMPADGESDVVANALARALGNCDRTTEYSTDYLTTLAALAFAAAGNFPSSSVFAKRASQNTNPGPAERWMMRVLANSRFSLSGMQPPSGFISYAQLTDRALKTGLREDFDEAATALQVACRESFEAVARTDRYLLLFWQQIHRRFEELSVARLLREIEFPNHAYISELVNSSSPLFYPAQARTLLEQPLTQPGQPVFITLPTSTGKSLLGEIALVSSLDWERGSRWLAVYLAPYRALTDQLQKRMSSRLRGIDIRCVIRRGGYLSDMSTIDAGLPTVLVATPEAFDALLRQRPELYRCLAACVFDEFHLIEQLERGLRYEGLLGRILCGAAGEGWPKVVALSAVVQDTTNVMRWLRIDHHNVARLPWHPTGRRLAIIDPQGNIEYFSTAERLPGTGGAEEVAWPGQIDLPYHITHTPTVRYTYLWDEYHSQVAENVAQVAVDQWLKFTQPILVLASSRAQTRLIARIVADRLPREDEATTAPQLARRISHRFPYLYTLQECLMHGVAYHNASLPDWVRGQIEAVMENKELKIVAATTTLAEGVDLPFRVVVLADWRQWLFGQRQPMPTLLFRNIAGRCGRAWEFAEGDTIIVDSPDEKRTNYRSRRQEYVRLYVNPPPYSLHSSVERALQSGNEHSLADTQATLESQFTAHVAVCDGSERLEDQFTQSLYAGLRDEVAEYIHDTMVQFTEYAVDEPNYPVLERRSPLRLTDFGQVVLRTGLSPRSGIALAYFTQGFAPPQEPGKGSIIRRRYGIVWEPLIATMWSRICEISDIRELEGSSRQQIGRRGYPVKLDNFPLVAMAWVSGVPIELIAFLTFRGDIAERNKIIRWLNEEEPIPTRAFEENIDHLAVFCNQYLAEQWSWIFRGASTIAEHLGFLELGVEITALSKRLEQGVKHLATVNLLEERRGCPVDRAKLDWLVDSFQKATSTQTKVLQMNQFLEWIRSNEEWLEEHRFTPFTRIRINTEDIGELKTFL